MIRIATLTLLFWSMPVLALAETVYVNDSLRVGVRAEPDSSTAPHGVVVTGMQLEVLDHAGGYIKIRNQSGVEGWIKNVYVTTEKPAKLELTALQAEQAKLQAQLAKQDKVIKDYGAKSTALSEQLQTLQSTNTELRTRLGETTTGKETRHALGYITYVVLLLVMVGAGFFAGVVWHRKQAMKRLGGLRV